MKITKEELAKKIEEEIQANIPIARDVLHNNLFKFNKLILKAEEGKGKTPLAPFHKEMCEFVEKRKNKKKLMLLPRGHLKSTLITVGYSLQRLLADPTIRILIGNATYNLACSFLTDIKRQLKFNENIHLIWGDLTKDPEKWSENEIMLGGIKTMHGKKEPNVTAMGVESNLTSQHYDLIILDDLVNDKYVNTREQIDKTINFYKESLNLLEPNGQAIILGTRWRDDDLYGWIMDRDNHVLSDFEVMIKRAYEGDLRGEHTLLYPEKFSAAHLQRLYEQQGPYFFSCTPAETPILMADFTNKPISEVKAGDEVIGFYRGEGKKNGKIVKSKVKAVAKYEDYVCDLKMESGRTVRCTKNHKWYSRKKDKTHRIYKPARVGTKLSLVCEPTRKISDKENLLWNYLAGFFDGDGSALGGAKMEFTQSSQHNPSVYKKILEVIKKLGLTYGEFVRKPSGNMIWINDSFNAVVDMIRYADFGKRYQLIDRLYKQGSKFVREYDKVLAIEQGKKKEMVYGLETETGNYVAWGYASSNSQYLNDPIPSSDADFKREWFQYFEFNDLEAKPMNRFTMIDPAISTEKASDFTAIVTVGLDENNNVFILDVRRIQAKPQGVIEEIFKVWEQWHPIYMGIEEVAFQKALRYSLQQEMNKQGKWLPLREVKPALRTKETRIRGLQPLYANRKVFHNKSVTNNVYLEDELLRFPYGKHDDLIDAFSYGLDFWFPGKRKVNVHSGGHRYLY